MRGFKGACKGVSRDFKRGFQGNLKPIIFYFCLGNYNVFFRPFETFCVVSGGFGSGFQKFQDVLKEVSRILEGFRGVAKGFKGFQCVSIRFRGL